MPYNGHPEEEQRQEALQKKKKRKNNLHSVTLMNILSNSKEFFRVPFDVREESKKSKIDQR